MSNISVEKVQQPKKAFLLSLFVSVKGKKLFVILRFCSVSGKNIFQFSRNFILNLVKSKRVTNSIILKIKMLFCNKIRSYKDQNYFQTQALLTWCKFHQHFMRAFFLYESQLSSISLITVRPCDFLAEVYWQKKRV